MNIPGVPTAETGSGAGAATGVAIPFGGIRTTSVLLAVVQHSGAGGAVGLNPGAFTIANGSIQSATIATTGHKLAILYVP